MTIRIPGATLTFAGGAGTVTGSKYLIETGDGRLLLDCGLFQGLKQLRLRNWADPPFDPRGLAAVVLSHGHLDHSGYLPRLVRGGFRGPVHCTPATADLLAVVLRDAAHIEEMDAQRANRHGYSKHHPALPLFTLEDVERVLELVSPRPFGEPFAVGGAAQIRFRRAGHILGAATVELQLGRAHPLRLVFSGDLGRWDRPILRDPELVAEADILLVESTYGDRLHSHDEVEQLARVISETAHRGGALIIPAFAIGRTQELLWTIRKLQDAGRLPLISVYLDSPMATAVTGIYCQHPEEHDLEMEQLVDQSRCPLCSRDHHVLATAEDSRALNSRRGPMVIIAGSGMATGGRVLHHLAHRLPDPRNTVLLTGFQAEGTRGRALQDGVRELKMYGRMVPVRAHVETIDGFSAHADRGELLRWLRGFQRPPAHTYVVHGEHAAAQALSELIAGELGWPATVAVDGATIALAAVPGPVRA